MSLIENRIKFLFGTGLAILVAILIWMVFLFVKDITSPKKFVLGESIILQTEQNPVSNSEDINTLLVSEEINNTETIIEENQPYENIPDEVVVTNVSRRENIKKTLIFVIDDAGNNLQELEPFLNFPAPITIAVLPGLTHSAESARRIREAGKEVILHQPMEAIGGQNPGPGAIYIGMNQREIRSIVQRNLDEIGPVAGMNNHQGSKITADSTIMETILTICQENEIYFLDSRTTAETVVPAVANRMGIKIEERNVFLDNSQKKTDMIMRVHEGVERANRVGLAIMIGHTWSLELAETLEELYPDLISQGYTFSTISLLRKGSL